MFYLSVLSSFLLFIFTLAEKSNITTQVVIPLTPGSEDYQLIGCYSELIANPEGRAIGLNNEYISPLNNESNDVTVALCLDACTLSTVPSGGVWNYAAVENARECFCGLTISSDSLLVDSRFCSTPCAGNASESCGGFGFLTLYGRIIAFENITTNINPTQTQSTSSLTTAFSTRATLITTSAARKASSTEARFSSTNAFPSSSSTPTAPILLPSNTLSSVATAGVVIASVITFLFILALLVFCIFRNRPKPQPQSQDKSSSTLFSLESPKELHMNPVSSASLNQANYLSHLPPHQTPKSEASLTLTISTKLRRNSSIQHSKNEGGLSSPTVSPLSPESVKYSPTSHGTAYVSPNQTSPALDKNSGSHHSPFTRSRSMKNKIRASREVATQWKNSAGGLIPPVRPSDIQLSLELGAEERDTVSELDGASSAFIRSPLRRKTSDFNTSGGAGGTTGSYISLHSPTLGTRSPLSAISSSAFPSILGRRSEDSNVDPHAIINDQYESGSRREASKQPLSLQTSFSSPFEGISRENATHDCSENFSAREPRRASDIESLRTAQGPEKRRGIMIERTPGSAKSFISELELNDGNVVFKSLRGSVSTDGEGIKNGIEQVNKGVDGEHISAVNGFGEKVDGNISGTGLEKVDTNGRNKKFDKENSNDGQAR